MTTLLRVCTAGSVDDGKSTLIGRLLHDTKSILTDQLEAVSRASEQRGTGELDLALLTDGLRAEREQGITIDVAYRYFATPTRSFILADTPGHAQYTRNMVTGASTAHAAIVLADAARGLTDQSRRHAAIASLLGIEHVVVAVNKMDLVDFDQAVFDRLSAELTEIGRALGLADFTAIPISALQGDNVAERSTRTPWYKGPTLLDWLEAVPAVEADHGVPLRFPIQWVIKPSPGDAIPTRGYAGRVVAGRISVGDSVSVLPSGLPAVVAAIETYDGSLDTAVIGDTITIRLDCDVDAGRGDLLVPAEHLATVAKDISVTMCWMSSRPAKAGDRVLVKHTTRMAPAIIDGIVDRLDLLTLAHHPADQLELNDLGTVRLRVAQPLAYDPYRDSRAMGALILVDPATNDTIAAGMVA